jgi:hypothetical protein
MIRIAYLLLALSLFMAPALRAQSVGSFKPTSVSVSTGKSALGSGLSGTVAFSNTAGTNLSLTVEADQGFVLVGRDLTKAINVSGALGLIDNTPWGGPLLVLHAPVEGVKLSTTQWPFFIAGTPGDPSTDIQYGGYFANIEAKVGGFAVTWAALKFLDSPWNSLPGVSYTHPITEQFEMRGGAEYNTNQSEPMFQMGLTWKPSSK